MLTLAAAKKGFRVVAIEEDEKLATILDSLARIMKLRNKIKLRVGDALSYSSRRKVQIMSNPPFTRHHSIPARRKRALAELASKFEVPLQLTTGYYGYFMAFAWAAGWSKRDVLLLPTNWLEARYGKALRQMLLGRGYEISIVENGHHTPVFDHALTTTCLLTTWPRAEGVAATSVSVLNGPKGRGDAKRQLAADLRLKLVNSRNNGPKERRVLGDVFKVRRGTATGDNAYFVLSLSQARKLGIGRKELVRVLHKLRPRPQSKDTAYLWSPADSPSEASLRRIKEGEELGVNKRYLCTHRKPWWRVERHGPPAYFLSYMGRGKPRIVGNRGGLINLNNTHGLYLKDDIPAGTVKKAIEWLGSKEGAAALTGQARHYFGGMWKLEPGDVERLSLPSEAIDKYFSDRIPYQP
jgi:adenine-specific DNA-methyltransferase